MKEITGYVNRPGGVKKFLYTGSKRDAGEEDQWTFAPKADNKSTGAPVDLNDVWSIQKNVSLGALAPLPGDRLNHNASKGFYSRHGGMKDGGKNAKPPEKADVGTAWAPARGGSFSYSRIAQKNRDATDDDSSSIASSRVSRGYHSNPSPRLFGRQSRPQAEDDF